MPKWWRGALNPAGIKDLFRTRPSTVRMWMRNVRAVEEALGREEALSYTRLLLVAASTELVHNTPPCLGCGFARFDGGGVAFGACAVSQTNGGGARRSTHCGVGCGQSAAATAR